MVDGVDRALVLAPHTDDGEFGCGGTISRLHDEDVEIMYVAFSAPEPSQQLIMELHAATARLGLDRSDVFVHGFETRRFYTQRQELLEELVMIEREWSPGLVFVPSADDIHQDHRVVHEEALRAFKRTSILGYELPWNNYKFCYQAFVPLRAEHLQAKVDALSCYGSQQHRPYAQEAYVRAVAFAHGVQCGHEHAEAFEVYRIIA